MYSLVGSLISGSGRSLISLIGLLLTSRHRKGMGKVEVRAMVWATVEFYGHTHIGR